MSKFTGILKIIVGYPKGLFNKNSFLFLLRVILSDVYLIRVVTLYVIVNPVALGFDRELELSTLDLIPSFPIDDPDQEFKVTGYCLFLSWLSVRFFMWFFISYNIRKEEMINGPKRIVTRVMCLVRTKVFHYVTSRMFFVYCYDDNDLVVTTRKGTEWVLRKYPLET